MPNSPRRAGAALALAVAASGLIVEAAAAEKPTPPPALCTRLPDPDLMVRCQMRAMFDVDLPEGLTVETVEGSVDYAVFAVRRGERTLLAITVGDFIFDKAEEGPDAFGSAADDGVRIEDGGRRRVRTVNAVDAEHVQAVLLLTSHWRPLLLDAETSGPAPPPGGYVLVEVPYDLSGDDQALAERLALAVRAR